MFLPWVAKCDLIQHSPDSYVLKKFSEQCQLELCSNVVKFLSGENVVISDVLPSAHHIRWSMEILGHSFALRMADADVISLTLQIYENWLGLGANMNKTNGEKQRLEYMQKNEQSFIQDLIGQMTLLFEERVDTTRSPEFLQTHVSLCSKVLDIFDALGKRRGRDLSSQTWDRMIRLLLGSADAVLHGTRSTIGGHLSEQLVRVLFEAYLRSLLVCGPRGELWNLLQKFYRRWIHRLVVVKQWSAVTLALTKSIMSQLYHPQSAKKDGKENVQRIEVVWAESRFSSSFEIESSLVAYAWYRLLRVIGHPSGITDPDVYLSAISGISNLVEAITHIDTIPVVALESTWADLQTTGLREYSLFGSFIMSTKSISTSALLSDDGSNAQQSHDNAQQSHDNAPSRAPPDVNTILRLLGPWLFDAALSRSNRFVHCRCKALQSLGNLLCQFSTGRSKRMYWAHSIRCLMALQTALLDDDERVNAAAIFNWSKVFGLYGNHTLRGSSIVVGAFHKAIERIYRVLDRTGDNLSSTTTGKDMIGDVPVVMLRRCSIGACSSLLTLHDHLPLKCIQDAEKLVAPEAMVNLPGLYSSLPHQTSSNSIGLLMSMMKSETNPVNQQMILWLLAVAVQQEVNGWISGSNSTAIRTSQVPHVILQICSIVTKSSRYKPSVLFAAFLCLQLLALHSDALYIHATSSVVHLMNTCCDFVTTTTPLLVSGRSPDYLDGLMSEAYRCTMYWIIGAPLLLSKSSVMSKVIQAIVASNDLENKVTSNAKVVGQALAAASSFVNSVMKYRVTPSTSYGSFRSGSSVLNEQSILTEFCEQERTSIEELSHHCRFFSLNKNAMLTIIEKQPNSYGSGETFLIVRDCMGRYVWRTKPRQLDGPLLPSLEDYEDYSEDFDRDTQRIAVPTNRGTISSDDNSKDAADPLLQAIRAQSSAGKLTSWSSKAHTTTSSAPLTVMDGEGNAVAAAGSKPNAEKERYDAFFTEKFLAHDADDLKAFRQGVTSDRNLVQPCTKPLPALKEKALSSWRISRRMMTELGFLAIPGWGSISSMDDAKSGDLLHDLLEFDKLSERETFEIAVAYATSERSIGGVDKVRLITAYDLQTDKSLHLSDMYVEFLAALGDRVRVCDHIGYSGSYGSVTNKQNVNENHDEFVYYGHHSCEACFYIPTIPYDSICISFNANDSKPNEMSMATRISTARRLFAQSNVMIVWNDSQQNYKPTSKNWASTFNLPNPTSHVVLIIDDLGNDLFCVHIEHSHSPIFSSIENDLANSESNSAQSGTTFPCVLGPLLDGMVVSKTWLAPLVRETALNAATMTRNFFRYQHSIGNAPSTPHGPHSLRGSAISDIIKEYGQRELPGTFYSQLFTPLHKERSPSETGTPLVGITADGA